MLTRGAFLGEVAQLDLSQGDTGSCNPPITIPARSVNLILSSWLEILQVGRTSFSARCQSASPFYNLLCCTNASLPKLFLQIYSTPGTSKQQIQCQICTTIANYSNNKHLNTIKCSQQFSSIGPLLCMDASLPHLFYQIQAQLFFYTISTLFGEEIRQRKGVVQYPHDVQAFAVLVSGI